MNYVLALLLWVEVWILAREFGLFAGILASMLTYFLCGYLLVRSISRHITFNRNFATVASVSKAKWATFVSWPIAVGTFIVQLILIRIL